MGWDCSHHPADPDLYTQRLVPFLLGHGDIDDLVHRAVTAAQVRFEANAWGLGARPLPGLDSWLHIWGRPYLITATRPADVSAQLQRWLAATPDKAARLARAELDRLQFMAQVDKDTGGKLPDATALALRLCQDLALMREAIRVIRAGGTQVQDGDRTHDARQLLARDALIVLATFASALQPGWMDRGKVWLTTLVDQAGLSYPEIRRPTALLGDLVTHPDLAGIDWFLEDGIIENDMVGGYVDRADVPPVHARLRRDRDALIAAFPDSGQSIQKLLEAFAHAELTGASFFEATEIYSGFSGRLN